MPSNSKKMQELILYVAERSECDQTFGATKLNKILFYADLFAFVETGKTITGEDYQKLEHGPAPRRLVPIQREMEQAGDCAVQTRAHFRYEQKRIVALRNADLSPFSGQEIAFVDLVLGHFQGRNAREVSDLSHDFIGWELVELGETIPLRTAFVSREKLSDFEKRLGGDVESSLENPTSHRSS
jgi:hypothetical protein